MAMNEDNEISLCMLLGSSSQVGACGRGKHERKKKGACLKNLTRNNRSWQHLEARAPTGSSKPEQEIIERVDIGLYIQLS